MRRLILLLLLLSLQVYWGAPPYSTCSLSAETVEKAEEDDFFEEDDDFFGEEDEGREQPIISDPLEKVNRVVFAVNDKLYRWVFIPLSKGYRKITPAFFRKGVGNFFSNLSSPIRIVNNGFQGKFKRMGTESLRFGINSTVGIAGVWDPSRRIWGIGKKNEDFGQTMGHYGLGTGMYICMPLLGPTNCRDLVGGVADGFINPGNYLFPHDYNLKFGMKTLELVNGTYEAAGRYEELNKVAIDPYLFVRDAVSQQRRKQVKE